MLAFLPNLLGTDGLIIFGILFFLFGAKKLPELAKGMVDTVKEFTKARDKAPEEPKQLPPPKE